MATEAGCLADVITGAFGAGVEDKVIDGITHPVWGGPCCKLWKESMEALEDGRGEVVKVGEMVGEGCGKGDRPFVVPHVETGGGSSDGTAHGDNEVGDGTGVGVHEAKPPLGDGDVGDEHGGFRDGISVGQLGKEVLGHGVNAVGKGACPGIP